ncbi:hypothetical protein [Nevskia soli]|jgi:hypothetical protein|uniref:hypothetical protein n=1 Tax=Nevskia soli TaxID=418856 RepID=UPI0015D6FE6F|nr:hypothetical protein [Nevskia soli]
MKLLTFLLICWVSSILASPASAQKFTFKHLEYPGAVQTYAQGINAGGEVVGYYVGTSGLANGFVYQGGTYTGVDITDSSSTWLYGVNKSGETVGALHRTIGSAAVTVGFTELDGTPTEFIVILARATVGQAINSAGSVVGYAELGLVSSPTYAAIARSASGTIAVLTVTGQSQTWATSINDVGVIAGYASTGTAYTDPVVGFTQLGSTTQTFQYPGALQTYFTGISNLNEIVGYYANSDGTENGFILANDVFTAFSDPSGIATFPQGVNASGVIVGYVSLSDTSTVGFVATPVK